MRRIGVVLPDDEHATIGELAGGDDPVQSIRWSNVPSRRARGVNHDDVVRRSHSVVGARVQRHTLSRCVERGERTEIARHVGDQSALGGAIEIYETYHALLAGP